MGTIGVQLAFVEGRNERKNNHRGRSSVVLSTQQTFSSFSHLIPACTLQSGYNPHFTDEETEAQLPRASQLTNSRAGPPPPPLHARTCLITPVLLPTHGGRLDRAAQGSIVQGEPGQGREIRRPDSFPGSTHSATLGKSQILPALHGLRHERMWSSLPY